MTKVEIIMCDTCGTRLEHGNSYAEKGWITLEGKMTIATGIMKSSYQGLWISQNQDIHHFCSIECLIKHNDNTPHNGHGKVCFAIKLAKNPESIKCYDDCFEVCKQKGDCTWYGKYDRKNPPKKK